MHVGALVSPLCSRGFTREYTGDSGVFSAMIGVDHCSHDFWHERIWEGLCVIEILYRRRSGRSGELDFPQSKETAQ